MNGGVGDVQNEYLSIPISSIRLWYRENSEQIDEFF